MKSRRREVDRITVSDFQRSVLPLLGGLVAALALSGCAWLTEGAPGEGSAAYYRTAFPIEDVAGELEPVLGAVARLQVRGTYETYHFSQETAASLSELRSSSNRVLTRAVDTVPSSSSRAATAVVIASSGEGRKLTLLSTEHVIHFPDTIVEYFGEEPQAAGTVTAEPAIQRISIKSRQMNSISTASMVEPFEILARDPSADLALIGVAPEAGTNSGDLRPLGLTGDPLRLSWGSFVYVLGYPAGFQMVTRGIVSEPERGPHGSFLLDGLWNEGMSGAPIMAVRGSGSGLEWVGIARAASARTEPRLVPADGTESEQDPTEPYQGPVYVEATEEIRYGITFSIPMPEIRSFIDAQREALRESGSGYLLPVF